MRINEERVRSYLAPWFNARSASITEFVRGYDQPCVVEIEVDILQDAIRSGI
jgi:hypothetical protein